MRITQSFVLVLLFVTLAVFTQSFLDARSLVSISYASADEDIAPYVATSTLKSANEISWSAGQEVADSDSEASSASIPAPTIEAASKATVKAKKALPPPNEKPVRVIIPSINLDTSIIGMGINSKGELDVPSGDTNNVGWFSGGPRPGQVGSAVLDAHVFAAFENLKYAKIGDEVIIETDGGTRLRFIIEESTVYKLSDITSHMLFGRNDARRLNLITCAGNPVGDTYSHRLVVYTRFVEVM